MIGSTIDTEIASSSLLSLRKISVRCAHGQASDDIEVIAPGCGGKAAVAGRPGVPSAVTQLRNIVSVRTKRPPVDFVS